MKQFEIKGNTTEKKFKYLEMVFRRFGRRLHKTVIGAIPPIVMLFDKEVVSESGNIFRCVFPCSGTLTKVYLYIGNFVDNNEVEFMATISSNSGNMSTTFTTKKHRLSDKTNIPIDAGDVMVLTTSSPDSISNVSAALLLEVGIKDTKKEVFLIDEFEKLIEGELEEDFANGQE